MKETFEKQNPWRYEKNYKFKVKERLVLDELVKNLENKKILGLIGSRQVGKSSLIYLLIQELLNQKIKLENIFYFNLDSFVLHELFENPNKLLEFIGNEPGKKHLFIDEIQRLKEPGLFLKEIYDLDLNIKIICSGSSQLEIKSKIKEHLGGRLRQFEIQRLSLEEYLEFSKPITKERALKEMLIYGSYPELSLCTQIEEKKLILRDIYQNYVQKDIIEFLNVENTTAFNKLITLLANQTGSLLNIDNLSKALRISRSETEKYISILEDTFIIKLIYPFYKNYKKEITKTPKIYFLDLGLRNFALNNFQDLELRNDIGELFENFYLLEMLAEDIYGLKTINFWRTTNQTEVDFILRNEEGLRAIEVKWDSDKQPKSFATLREYYPEMQLELLNKTKILGM